MRIQPGAPERVHSIEGPGRVAGGFRGALAQRIDEASVRWRQLVGADPRWSAAPILTPPERPVGLETEGPEAKRSALQAIAAGEGGGAAMEKLRAMLRERLALEEAMLTYAAVRGGK